VNDWSLWFRAIINGATNPPRRVYLTMNPGEEQKVSCHLQFAIADLRLGFSVIDRRSQIANRKSKIEN
jgi:hypothetical protein